MKKSLLIIASIATLSGCSVLNKPKLYGNKSCGEGKTAYVYSSGNAAICLNEASVAYMVCARELGVLSAESKGAIKGSLSADILEQGKGEVSGEKSQEVVVKYAHEGPLAEATAKAIGTCIEIHNTYR